MNLRAVLVGVVVGLVFGAGIASLVWALTAGSGSGTDEDVAAVCGIVERTPLPTEDTPIEDLRRWAVAEVMPSVAKADPSRKPLADALEKAERGVQQLNLPAVADAAARAKQLCG